MKEKIVFSVRLRQVKFRLQRFMRMMISGNTGSWTGIKGHALILPKEHYHNLYDIDEEVAAKAMILAKKMVNKLTKVLDCDGYNIVQNNEECAGQSVFHFHMHLIPRYKGDQVGLGWKMGELSEEDKKEILDKMK